MEQSSLGEMQRLLEGQLQRLVREVRDELDALGQEDLFSTIAGPVPDLGDQSMAEILLTLEDSVVRDRIGELTEVEHALERIAQGTYGRCMVCGDPIPLARLRVRPAARRCVACREELEQRMHRTAAGAG